MNYYDIIKKDIYNWGLAFDTKPDGTYAFETGNPVSFEKGFQVSFETKDDTYTPEQYNDLVARLKSRFKEIYVGVYKGHTELSVHVQGFEQAVKLGSLFKQYSIWDWAKGQEIVLWWERADDKA